jgi:hypothetical protein
MKIILTMPLPNILICFNIDDLDTKEVLGYLSENVSFYSKLKKLKNKILLILILYIGTEYYLPGY